MSSNGNWMGVVNSADLQAVDTFTSGTLRLTGVNRDGTTLMIPTGNFQVVTKDIATGPTCGISLTTGNASAGTSGDITLTIGSASGAQQATGDIVLVLTAGANGAASGNLIIVNLPTSPTGLPANAIWCDTGASNILKRV